MISISISISISMSSAPAKTAGDARYASQDPVIHCPNLHLDWVRSFYTECKIIFGNTMSSSRKYPYSPHKRFLCFAPPPWALPQGIPV